MAERIVRYIPIPPAAHTTADDLAEIVCGSTDWKFHLLEVRVTNTSDAGDAESEQLTFHIKRGIGETSGSGGSAMTFVDRITGSTATKLSGAVNNTTQATAGSGSLTTIVAEAENIHNGWYHSPPEWRSLVFLPGETSIISLGEAPADSITLEGYAVIEEYVGS